MPDNLNNMQQINNAIKALETIRDEAPLVDTPSVDGAIAKLEGKKELLATDHWDDFKSNITDADFAKLHSAQQAFADATQSEEARTEKLSQGVAISKKIIETLKKLPI